MDFRKKWNNHGLGLRNQDTRLFAHLRNKQSGFGKTPDLRMPSRDDESSLSTMHRRHKSRSEKIP